MPRNMSFAMTTRQFREKTKNVTRRFGWWNLKPGEVVEGVEKGMGLKKGERIVKLGQIVILSTRTEPLNAITQDDCIREGFPDLTPEQFVDMLCRHYGCRADQTINRIEFGYL